MKRKISEKYISFYYLSLFLNESELQLEVFLHPVNVPSPKSFNLLLSKITVDRHNN